MEVSIHLHKFPPICKNKKRSSFLEMLCSDNYDNDVASYYLTEHASRSLLIS